MTNRLHGLGKKVGLRISDGKTKNDDRRKNNMLCHQSLSTTRPRECAQIPISRHITMAEDGDVEDKDKHIGKTSCFPTSTAKCGTISKKIKLRLYSSIVVPTSTSACETWKTTAKATKMIDVFHRRCLRRILGISWRDHITDYEVMTVRSYQTPLHDIVALRRRRFIGHILRLPPTRLASLITEWRPEVGKRNIGRPKRTWQDTVKEDLEVMGMD